MKIKYISTKPLIILLVAPASPLSAFIIIHEMQLHSPWKCCLSKHQLTALH